MNKILIVLLTFFSVNNHTNDQIDTNTEVISQDKIIKTKEPYTLNFHLEKLKNNTYNLIIKMELEKDAHYVSPNSKGSYSGIFAMILEENTKLNMSGKFSESPLAKEKVDPWTGNPASFVREDTTHTQQFTVTDTNDFEVSGLIQFTIEPRCTLEKIKFTISSRNGKLAVKKVNTTN